MNVALFGSRIIANEIKKRSLWWILVQYDWCPKGKFGHRKSQTWVERHVETRKTSEQCSCKARNGKDSNKPPEKGETHEQAPTLLRGAHSHHRLDLGLLASRTVKTKTLCCLSHPAHSTYLRQAQHTNKPPPHVLWQSPPFLSWHLPHHPESLVRLLLWIANCHSIKVKTTCPSLRCLISRA